MGNRFEDLNLTTTQTEWFCRGLMDLASSDGVHESELELIEEFCTSSNLDEAAVARLSALGFSASEAKAHLEGVTLDAFMTTCYVLAYADGELSDIEAARLQRYADEFGYSNEQLAKAHVEARQFLISSLANEIKNHVLVREIGAAIGLTESQINAALAGGN